VLLIFFNVPDDLRLARRKLLVDLMSGNQGVQGFLLSYDYPQGAPMGLARRVWEDYAHSVSAGRDVRIYV
jgi:hypothetical protein